MVNVTGALEPVELSILIVSYNSREMTLACLASVFEQTWNMSYEVIVVDNASTDGSAEAIRALGLPIRLIALKSNIGFARANNVASGEARGEHVLLLNPDTVVLDRAIDRLWAFARTNPAASIWGGKTVFADGTLNPSCCWRRMTPWNVLCRALGLTGLAPNSPLFNSEAYGGWARDSHRHVDIVSGCFFLIRRDLWETLDGFDPSYFMYGEEADLCLRAAEFGARPLFTPDAVIIHHGGASETSRVGKLVKLLTAKATLVRRHWHPILEPFGLALLAVWPIMRYWALKVAGAVTARSDWLDRAHVWREVFAARQTWLGGYSDDGGAMHPLAS